MDGAQLDLVINVLLRLVQSLVTDYQFASREMIVNNSRSLGMILTFSSLAGMVIGSFSSLIEQNLALQEYKIILKRFFDFEENKVGQTETQTPGFYAKVFLPQLDIK